MKKCPNCGFQWEEPYPYKYCQGCGKLLNVDKKQKSLSNYICPLCGGSSCSPHHCLGQPGGTEEGGKDGKSLV